jgi:hypothetical protein
MIKNSLKSNGKWPHDFGWNSDSDVDSYEATQSQFWESGSGSTGSDNMSIHHTEWSEWVSFDFLALDTPPVAAVDTPLVVAIAPSPGAETTQPNAEPVVTITHPFSQTTEWSHVGTWAAYFDADGDPAALYQFRDDGTASNSAYLWTPDNAHHAAGSAVTVAAADLDNVWVRSGAPNTSDKMWVRAFDGADWSVWKPIYFETTNANVSYGSVTTLVNAPLALPEVAYIGEAGSDTFLFNQRLGDVRIVDFDPTEDVIHFKGFAITDFAAVISHTHDDGHGNAVIDYDLGGAITIENVMPTMLHSSNFLFE